MGKDMDFAGHSLLAGFSRKGPESLVNTFDSEFGILNSEFSELMGKDMDFARHSLLPAH